MSQELSGFTEASTGPSSHNCPGHLVDATISRRRVILVCYRCDTYWHTGQLENDLNGKNSLPALVRAAEEFYRHPQYIRSKLQHERRDAEAWGMYCLYRRGRSLSQIADLYQVSRQAVYERFKRRGYRLRSVHSWLHQKIEWNGSSYTPGKGGYYRRTGEPRSLLHHDVWEFHHGPVPAGHQVFHVDGDLTHNEIDNLICLPTADLTRLYHPARKIPDPPRCRWCGAELTRKTRPGGTLENPAALMRRKYCDRECFAQHRDSGYAMQLEKAA